jgi:L-malate glycosyltransferase
MKITFIIGQYKRISGGNRILFEYANRLQERGNQVAIYSLAKPAKWYRIDHWKRIVNKEIKIIPPKAIDWLENTIPINELSCNHESLIPDSDILLATAWQTADYSNCLPCNKGAKFYLVQSDESIWAREKDKAYATYYMPFKKIAVSTWLKDILREQYTQEAEVLLNPVSENLFYPEEENQRSISRVCFLHHDYEFKGYKEAIEAVKIIKSRNYKIDPVVFGEKLQDPAPLYEDAGFKFEYHYRPTGKALRRLYSSCGIYMCASWHEGSGLPGMEAIACGAALVTTDTGGSRDYAFDGETALVSPPKQPEQLANNLARILSDEALWSKLVKKGTQKIREASWDTNCSRLEEIFKKSIIKPN